MSGYRGNTRTAYQISWVTTQLGVGKAPLSYPQIDAIREQGIDAILNLCGEFYDLHEIESKAGFEVYYLPLDDAEAPGLIELENALEWLDEALYLGKKVLIHCRHGIGRTGTVLNAYLLRRGLGHKLASKALKKLKSKPTNFVQWRTVRRYGKKSGRLTVRAPYLEFKRRVDLSPFLDDYKLLIDKFDDSFPEEKLPLHCNATQTVCCSLSVQLTLAEAVYVNHRINRDLTGAERQKLIERAVEAGHATQRVVQVVRDAVENLDHCILKRKEVCPLLTNGKCLLFESRPFQCRSIGRNTSKSRKLWDTLVTPTLETISSEIWLAYTGTIVTSLPKFALVDVISGKFVETIFKFMMQQESVKTNS